MARSIARDTHPPGSRSRRLLPGTVVGRWLGSSTLLAPLPQAVAVLATKLGENAGVFDPAQPHFLTSLVAGAATMAATLGVGTVVARRHAARLAEIGAIWAEAPKERRAASPQLVAEVRSLVSTRRKEAHELAAHLEGGLPVDPSRRKPRVEKRLHHVKRERNFWQEVDRRLSEE